MNELYYGSHELPDLDDIDYMIGEGIPLQADANVSSAIAFDEKALIEALKRIYSQEFRPMTDIEEHLFEETLRLMLQATDEGMAMSGAEVAKEFRTRMDWNTARWSAFKVHRMQNDIAAQLYDEDGTLKSFDQWAKDVEPMLDHHVNHWLRTEYNTAVIRAQQAADWQRFEEYADVMPNLTWLPSTSAQPGADHKIFWGVTLPIDHPFWNSHRPGDRWGCKCSLENTDDEPTAIPQDPDPKQNRPADGLDNNPGKDGKLFSDSHPYIAKATPQAHKAVEKYMSEKVDLEKPVKVKVEKVNYETVPTENGSVRIHPGHGKNEKKENVEIASYLANKYGFEIELLDNPQDRKSADSYNHTLGIEQEYKVSTTASKNSIDRLVRDGKKQADNIVLRIDSEITWSDLSAGIRSRVRRSENIESITVIIDNRDVTFTREQILSEGFKIQLADLK